MSHGPPDLPIHLVPPLGGLLSTRGGHGKGLQPCFTIREDLTERLRGAHFEHLSNTSSTQVLDCSNTSSCQSNQPALSRESRVLTLDPHPGLVHADAQ